MGDARKLTNSLAWAALLMCLSLPGARAEGTGQCEGTTGFGSLLNEEEFSSSVQALPPEALAGAAILPVSTPRITLRNLPAVAQQGTDDDPGSPGSCEAQSFGYGLGSYTAARDVLGFRKWNPALPQYSTSAAYLYALAHLEENKSCPQGSMALGYLAQLTSRGAPSRALVPYKPYCSYLDAVPSQPMFPNLFPGMSRFRIGSYAALQIHDNPDAINQIKGFLRNGQAVAFSGLVLCGYAKKPVFENGVIYETGTLPPPSGHGQLVVGYDDTVGKDGYKGALLVQNSFGIHWPPSGTGSIAPPGMAYWSYSTFSQTQKLAAVAYPRSDWLLGLWLKPSRSKAPFAVITRSYQWTPGGASPESYLILGHGFKDPVKIETVALTEPNGSSVMATATYGQYISTGYSYLKRGDGNAFLGGIYTVKLSGVDLNGTPITYTGKALVTPPRSSSRPGKSMAGVAITGSTGTPADLSD
ncbi:hypothetical protein [Aestuariivirga sp.]|uniref:hypothetical protein n=1 Tax=Aestuariivirga sp. TaxID=2650926 RepID=UPI003BAADFA4